MTAIAAAAGGFLLAVLWFDLMFDVQVRGHAALPAGVLVSISAYYRRVTTEARPMNRLVTLVMAVVLITLIAEIAMHAVPARIAWLSLAAALSGIGLAAARTVRNAIQLGGAQDAPEEQARLARTIYRDHLFCFAAIALMVALQLAAAQISA